MKQQQVIDNLKLLLADIIPVNGYYTSIGNNVNEWSAMNISVDELPACNIKDVEDNIAYVSVGQAEHTLTTYIDVVAYGNNVSTYLRQAYNDISKAIGANNTLNGVVNDMEIEKAKFQADQTTEKIMSLTVIVTISYYTDYYKT